MSVNVVKSGGKLTSFMPILVNKTRDDYADSLRTLRILFHGQLLAFGMNPTMIGNVFNPHSTVSSALNLLQSSGESVGSERLIKADAISTISIIESEIRSRIAGEYMSIVVDSASLKHDSAIAVLASCSKLQRPILLSLIYPDLKSHDEDINNKVYNFQLAAKDILVVMVAMGIDIKEQVSCIMGDNVNHNIALAKELGKQLLMYT
jgi:hypothetical protein